MDGAGCSAHDARVLLPSLKLASEHSGCAQGSFLGGQRSASASLGLAGSGGFSSQLSGSPSRELLSGFAARVARAGSPGGRASPGRSAYGSVGSLTMSRAASAGLPPLGSPGPTSVRLTLDGVASCEHASRVNLRQVK